MIKLLRIYLPAYVLSLLTLLLATNTAFAQLRPNLGTASTYAIFTGGGAINVVTGDTAVLTGDVGQDGAYAFNGFPPSTYTGTLNRNNSASAIAKQALIDAQTADGLVACGTVLGTTVVDGQSFDPGVYCSGGATTTVGNITFNAHGNGSAIFIVKIGGQLTAHSTTHILLSNNARAANIYWFVDGAVTVADSSSFTGTIIAKGAISFAGQSSLNGRALVAPLGAINLASNHMSIPTDSGTANNLTVVKPASGDSILRNTLNDTIRWTGTGIARVKTLQYSLDSGFTWATIATITTDSLNYVWHVPDTTSTKVLVRVTDTNNLRGVSGIFKIISNKLIVVNPAAGALITEGTQHDTITWTGTGLNHIKTFALSLDSGATWTTIGKDTTNGFTYLWNVPNTVSTKAMISITDSNGVTGQSGVFTIKSSTSPAIIVMRPTAGESIVGATQAYSITWTGSQIATQKIFAYSLDGGLTWRTIDTMSADIFTHNWNVPDTASTQALVRITDKNGLTGTSGLFRIISSKIPVIVVTRPAASESIAGGTAGYSITWTGTGIAAKKTIALSLDNGAHWDTIGVVRGDIFNFGWNVPDTATTMAMVSITDSMGLIGKSGVFTITSSHSAGSINSLTLSPLVNNNIGNQAILNIAWTFTPDIGPSMVVAFLLNSQSQWTTLATVTTSESSSAMWMTPATGYYPAVLIRITSTNGMTKTSDPFSIGSNASVASEASSNGYSVSNYPNPANSQTTFNIVLPTGSDVAVTIADELGRPVGATGTQHFDAGRYDIPFNTSSLAPGMYVYTLQAGTNRVVGRLNIIP